MSEKTKKTPEVEEEMEAVEETEKTAGKVKKAVKKSAPEKEKKENIFKRGYKRVKKGMSDHPFWTAFGSAAVGSGLTIGAGYGAKKFMENRRQKKQNASYIPGNDNDLNPNM